MNYKALIKVKEVKPYVIHMICPDCMVDLDYKGSLMSQPPIHQFECPNCHKKFTSRKFVPGAVIHSDKDISEIEKSLTEEDNKNPIPSKSSSLILN